MAERLQSEILADDTNPTPPEATPATRKINPYRAYRELERWLYGGVNVGDQPRPDQHGTSDTYERLYEPPYPAIEEGEGELLWTIVYTEERDEQGNVINVKEEYIYPDRSQVEISTTQE